MNEDSQKHPFTAAVKGLWDSRIAQRQAQLLRGTVDQGNRGAATGGKQMDGFLLALSNALINAGVDESEIHVRKSLTVIPGYYRPSKVLDLLVVRQRQLRVAIELKSHIGPSFGNNFNNRVEEAMGSSLDFWQAYKSELFQLAPPPWFGYLLALESCPASRKAVRAEQPHFKADIAFNQASYVQRYQLFCERMVRERQFNAACLLLVSQEHKDAVPNYQEASPQLGAALFIQEMVKHAL